METATVATTTTGTTCLPTPASRWSGLHRNFGAVCNAIELPWSNGQADDQINRLKTIKRAMYGKAGAVLLRARMLLLNNNHHPTK